MKHSGDAHGLDTSLCYSSFSLVSQSQVPYRYTYTLEGASSPFTVCSSHFKSAFLTFPFIAVSFVALLACPFLIHSPLDNHKVEMYLMITKCTSERSAKYRRNLPTYRSNS